MGGRFQREANFPEMIASYSLGQEPKRYSLSLCGQGQLTSLWPSQRPVFQLLCVQKTATPGGFPAGVPRTVEKCRLSGGVRVLPLSHPKVGTSQTSGFVFGKVLPRCEQRASREPSESAPSSGWQRPFWGGHSQCLPRLAEISERRRWDMSWVGSCLLWLPSVPVLPLHIF